MTANNSTNNNVMFFFLSDLKIVYDNNYKSLITVPWTREETYLASLLIRRQNHSKLCKQKFAGGLTLTIISRYVLQPSSGVCRTREPH